MCSARSIGSAENRTSHKLALVATVLDGPVATVTADDANLLQETGLIPVQSDLLDEAIFEVDDVDLMRTDVSAPMSYHIKHVQENRFFDRHFLIKLARNMRNLKKSWVKHGDENLRLVP